jgi:hypothetical protein
MPHFRQNWIEALESGRFPQVFGRYKSGDARCAMGVAFEVLNEQTEKFGFPGPANSRSFLRQYGTVCELVGMTSRQGQIVEQLNDVLCLSHVEIARIVRQLDNRDAMVAAEHDPVAWHNNAPPHRLEEKASPK